MCMRMVTLGLTEMESGILPHLLQHYCATSEQFSSAMQLVAQLGFWVQNVYVRVTSRHGTD